MREPGECARRARSGPLQWEREWKNQKGETHGIYYGLKIGDSEGGWVHEVVGPGVFRTCYSSKA